MAKKKAGMLNPFLCLCLFMIIVIIIFFKFFIGNISRISTDDERFSRVVVHGNTVYLSGLVPPAEVREFGIRKQVDATLEKVDELLAKAGTNKSKLLSANIWLKTMDDYKEMNERWIEWLDPDNKPVRACVEAGFSKPEILFEVMVVAAK